MFDWGALWVIVLPILGLLVGSILSWLIPYLRAGLEKVQETDSWKDWPKFKPGYLAMTAYPLLPIAVSCLTSEGALEAILSLSFINAVLTTYAGARVGHEGIKIIQAGSKFLICRFKPLLHK